MPEITPGLVSTIIPCYNRPQMLREAVESVLCQTYRNIEIIIVDDGSTDDAPMVAQQMAADYPEIIRFHQKENSGPGPTREAGRQLARGEFIQYLDSDDLLRPRKFELMVQALHDRPDCGAAYGWICVRRLNQPPGTEAYKGSGTTRETLFPWLLSDRWWNTDCPLFRRSVTDQVGPWTDLRWSQDWEYDARVAALGTKLAHVQDWVCDERHHSTGRQTDFADWANDPVRLRSRKQFLQLMLQHAETAQIDEHSAERQHLTRWIFTTARNCAANGLVDEARDLMESAERSAGKCKAVRSGFGIYNNIARLTGVRNAARILRLAENLRRPGQFTQLESFAR